MYFKTHINIISRRKSVRKNRDNLSAIEWENKIGWHTWWGVIVYWELPIRDW